MKGWVPAWRQLFDPSHPLAPTKLSPASKIHAWLDLCQLATHRDYRHRDIELKRGEVVVSVRMLAERWAWSKSRVGRFLVELESRTQIGTVSGTPHGTVYRIINYDTYAVDQSEERDTHRDRERDTRGTAAGQEQQQNNKTSTSLSLGGAKKNGRKRATQLPDGWAPNGEHRARALAAGIDIDRELDRFKAYCRANGRTYRNWNAAFVTWLMRAEEYQQDRVTTRTGSDTDLSIWED